MLAAKRIHRYKYADYVGLEQISQTKHEFLDGEIYAMAGGSPDHAALAAAVIHLLRAQLPPECRMFTSDLRVRIPATGLSTYPDAAVVCGRTLRASDDALAVTNPVLLVEVTSPSTEDYDRGEKLRHYMQLPSVREVLFVSHREARLTVHRRENPGRKVVDARQHEIVTLEGVAAQLAVDDVYRDGLEDLA